MFFEVIDTLATNLNKIDLIAITETALQARPDIIAELNRDQLRQGQTASGNFLPPYSAKSVDGYGKPPGPIKLYDTGDFYKGIKPDFAQTSFIINDTDDKTDMLKADYGDDILGLSQDNIGELAQDALGQIQYEIRRQL